MTHSKTGDAKFGDNDHRPTQTKIGRAIIGKAVS